MLLLNAKLEYRNTNRKYKIHPAINNLMGRKMCPPLGGRCSGHYTRWRTELSMSFLIELYKGLFSYSNFSRVVRSVNNNNNNFIACKASGPKYIEQYLEQLSKCRESATLSLYITS